MCEEKYETQRVRKEVKCDERQCHEHETSTEMVISSGTIGEHCLGELEDSIKGLKNRNHHVGFCVVKL